MRLPDHLRRDKAPDLTPWARQQHPGVPVAAFLEGPSFDRAGNLYCVDIAHGRIFRTTPDGTVSVVTEHDGEPNGLKIHTESYSATILRARVDVPGRQMFSHL